MKEANVEKLHEWQDRALEAYDRATTETERRSARAALDEIAARLLREIRRRVGPR